MLFILFVLYIFQDVLNAGASPLSPNFARQTNVGSAPVQDSVCPQGRSVWNILWSCLVTIFACSWVSVHPNIPGQDETWRKKHLRRMELMFWSIIFPELIIFWAMRQWLGARKLTHMYGWTKTHGYFIQMGGFVLYDGGKAIGVLDPEKLQSLLADKEITLPSITEEEIKDHSKGDGLSKALVVVQTTWFTIQCIARRVEGLAITQLELATVAFAVLNSAMYFLWWNKPLGVEAVVPVYLSRPKPEDTPPLPESIDEKAEIEIDTSQVKVVWTVGSMAESNIPVKNRVLRRNIRDLARRGWRLFWTVLRWPANRVLVILSRMTHMLGRRPIGEGEMRVPTFYFYGDSEGWELFALLALLACITSAFGGIHCDGWNFAFPSRTESNIWRISSVIITSIPATIIGVTIFSVIISLVLNLLLFDSEELLQTLMSGALGFLLACYILARLTLLVETLISLRDLPPGAFAVAEWTSFIPHV